MTLKMTLSALILGLPLLLYKPAKSETVSTDAPTELGVMYKTNGLQPSDSVKILR